MRSSSSVVVLALVAAAAAAPIAKPDVEARAGLSSLGGFSKVLGNVASGAGILSSGINIGNFLSGLFGGDDAARRELMEVGARELDERAGLASLGKVGNNLLNLGSLGFSLGNIGDAVSGLFSREEAELFAREVDARAGLASLGKVGNNLLNLGSLGFSLGNIGDAVSGLFSRDEEFARSVLSEIEDHVTRQLMAREVPEVEARAAAGGLSKILGNATSGAGLLSSGINIGNFLSGLFGGDDAAARRDLSDMEARAGLASLGKVGNNLLNLGSLGFSLGNIGDAVSGLFSREITEEYVREVIEQEIYRRAVADLD